MRIAYYRGETNRCPYCSGKNWVIRSITAECGNCGGVLELAERAQQPSRPLFRTTASRTAMRYPRECSGLAA